MAVRASCSVRPTTSGTVFCSTPREMTAVTACPTGMAVPVGGLQEMTEPETTVSE